MKEATRHKTRRSLHQVNRRIFAQLYHGTRFSTRFAAAEAACLYIDPTDRCYVF